MRCATTGLAFTNKSGRLQDSFRGRVMFPIFTENGDPVAFGGRILPGSTDPAKYKNSAETYIYAKSKTLYGLHWAKGDIVAADQVIVCEGYTDVIGFHRAGVKRAVATCGTALTEEHVRMLKRFASRVVLAFDADAAGQGAAEKFYEWEQKYQVQVSVAAFPKGQDPGELSLSEPCGAGRGGRRRVAVPRVPTAAGDDAAGRSNSPEDRARLAEQAMAVVNEHPDANVRKLYAGQVASHTGLPINDLVAHRRRGARRARSCGVGDARTRRQLARTPSSSRSPCCCSAGTTWPVARRGAVRRRCRTARAFLARRRRRRLGRALAGARRPRGPRDDRAGRRRRHRRRSRHARAAT